MNVKTSNNFENDISLEDSLVKDISLLNSKRLNTNDFKIRANLLINALNDFSDKYESDTRNILLNQKFVLSFKEIIQLMRDSIDTQRKIDELNTANEEFVRNLTQNFINNLSYNIFCFVKIDKDFYGVKKKIKNNKKIQHSKKNSDFSIKICNSGSSRNYHQKKTSSNLSMHTNTTTTSTNRKRSVQKDIQNKQNNDEIFSKKKLLCKERSLVIKKSIEKRKSCNQITKMDKNLVQRRNSSVMRRHKIIAPKEEIKSGSPHQNNHSTEIKKKNKKYSDIYSACENLNLTGNNNILMKRNKLMRNSGIFDKKFGTVDCEEEIIIGNDYKSKDGFAEIESIQTKVLSKAPKPSIYAKQLLIKGRQYINDFNGYSEHEKY